MSVAQQRINGISKRTWDRLLDAIKEAYGIELSYITPTPTGSSLSDFPAYKEYKSAPEKMTTLLGIHVYGDEFLYDIAVKMEANLPAH